MRLWLMGVSAFLRPWLPRCNNTNCHNSRHTPHHTMPRHSAPIYPCHTTPLWPCQAARPHGHAVPLPSPSCRPACSGSLRASIAHHGPCLVLMLRRGCNRVGVAWSSGLGRGSVGKAQASVGPCLGQEDVVEHGSSPHLSAVPLAACIQPGLVPSTGHTIYHASSLSLPSLVPSLAFCHACLISQCSLAAAPLVGRLPRNDY